MTKSEKKEGIPPVQVRRQLQPETIPKRAKKKYRWHGRYNQQIYDLVKEIKTLAKIWQDEDDKRSDLYRKPNPYRNAELYLKEGYRAAKENKLRKYPESNWERGFLTRHPNATFTAEHHKHISYWYKGWDVAQVTEI